MHQVRARRDRAAELRRAEVYDDDAKYRAVCERACIEHLLDLRDHFDDGHGEDFNPSSGNAVRATSYAHSLMSRSVIGSPAAMCAEMAGDTGRRR